MAARPPACLGFRRTPCALCCRFGFRLVAFATVLLLTSAPPARGMQITVNFNSGASDNPSIDPDGSKLQALFDFAESYYEDIFEGTTETGLTLTFWYEELDGNTIGKHSLTSQNGSRETAGTIRIDPVFNWFIDPTPADNSEFNMQQTLWRDLTGSQPTDWYDVGSGSVIPETFEVGYTGVAFSGTEASGKTDMLSVVLHEVGHAIGMSSSAGGTTDETGQEILGVFFGDRDYDFFSNFVFGQSLAADVAADDNIAHLKSDEALMNPIIPNSRRRLPSHTDLFSMAAGADWPFLDVPRREFYGGSNWNDSGNWSGDRVPASNDDVYIRSAHGTGTENRAGLTANGSAANLFVSETGVADTNGFKLDVSGDATVNGPSARIYINDGGEFEADEVFIENGSQIRMTGGTLDVRRLTINEGTSLEIDNEGTGTVQVDDELVNNGMIDPDQSATFVFEATSAANPWNLDGTTGNGFVRANDGDVLFNSGGMSDSFDGEIEVGPGYRFHFNNAWTNKTGLIDLNGGTTTATRAYITGGLITFNGGEINADNTDAAIAHIDSDISISGGNVIVGQDDYLELNGAATVSGGTFNLNGGAEIQFDGTATISGGTFEMGDDFVEFNAAATVSGGIFNMGDSAEIQFDGDTTFTGGAVFNMTGASTSTGFIDINSETTWAGGTTTFNNGVVQMDGTVTVSADTTVNAGVFDLEGSSDTTVWTFNKTLTVNADQVDTSNNQFDGTMNFNNPGTSGGGAIVVNLPGNDQWTMDGTANVDGSVASQTSNIPAVFQGEDVLVSGTINVQDRAASTARIILTGDITTADAASLIQLRGGTVGNPNRIEGGEVTGPGSIGSTADHALVGYGTITSKVSFAGNSELRADDGTLSVIGASIVDVGTLGTADADGTLNVTGGWNTNVADKVELKGGSILGGIINNGAVGDPGLIIGFGTVAPSNIVNNGTIAASGGTLVVNTISTPYLDGIGGSGNLNAVSGNLEIVNSLLNRPFNGTATVGSTHTITFTNGWVLDEDGVLNLNGGSSVEANAARISGSTQELRGTVNVDRLTQFEIPTVLAAGVQVHMQDTLDALRLAENTIVRQGATFTGSGRLITLAGATLTIEDDATIGVSVVNFGDMTIGSSPGNATLAAFTQQTSNSHLEIEIGGTTAGDEYDQLLIDGLATLDGYLDVSFIDLGGGLFSPSAGDQFDIIAAGSRSGAFDFVNLPTLAPQLVWDVGYHVAGLTLSVSDVIGDLNGDGMVTTDDVSAFVLALTNRAAYDALYDFVDVDHVGDVNENGTFDFGDIGPFQSLVASAAAAGSSAAVPEPATLVLSAFTLIGLASRRVCSRHTKRSAPAGELC